MRDLERATGVGRETIRFYIRQGLLPEPERPGRNAAWYDESFVERVLLIKDLQRKRFLPLHAIKRIVGSDTPPSRAEVEALLDLDGKLFRNPPAGRAERMSDVAKRSGLRATEVRAMADLGAIAIATRDGDQWLEADDAQVVELWGAVRRAGYTTEIGFPVENLRLYVEAVRWLAREELRLFTAGVTGRVEGATAVRMAEEGIARMNEIIALIRKATLLRYIAQGNLPWVRPDEAAVAGKRRGPSGDA